MDIDKSQFFEVFYEETAEHLTAMEELLINLNIAEPESEDLNAIFRAVHSIKGGAGTFGFDALTRVAHVFETVLDKVRKGTMSPTSKMVDLFLECGDVLEGFLGAYRNSEKPDESTAKAVMAELTVLAESADEAPDSLEAVSDVEPEENVEEDPGFGFFDDGPLFSDSGETVLDSEDEAGLDPLEGPSVEAEVKEAEAVSEKSTKTSASAVSAVPERRTTQKGRRRADKPVSGSSETTSIRIGVEKVDQLFNQVGEIVITQAMLSLTASKLDPAIFEQLKNGLAQLERNTRDLQDSVMSIRMVPIRIVFSRFPRLIRDMARNFGKEVDLVLEGEDTEIDKGFIEKLSDPLTHLIRNSFDHGIESPEERQAAGKDSKGTIELKASHQGGNVVIQVIDNGAGLNRKRILAKAAEQGIAVNDGMPDSEVWQLVCAPGFSTAAKVSDLSGRGVGMDVVKRNVQSMGGEIEIESTEGKGSCFTIRLPLTLAIIEGMVVRVGKETYILPLISIVESIRPKPEELNRVMGKGELVNMRGEYVPIVRLDALFSGASEISNPCEAVLVVVESEGRHVAVMVDELLGQQQVVIKSMESNYRRVPGIAGATILGDGQVSFILDIRGILAEVKRGEISLVA